MHPVEDIRGSGDNLDCRRVELSTNVTLARSRWASNYYITPVTGSSDQLGRRCWNENHVPAEAGPPGLQLSSPGEWKRNAVIARRAGRSICCSSVQSPTHLSYSKTFCNPFQPFQIKWEVHFSKELCPLFFIVLNMFLHASAYGYVTTVEEEREVEERMRCTEREIKGWSKRSQFPGVSFE